MKILAIRGCNLASLAGEFEIDLARAPLGGAGVFAIVGNTGAGKSTLLDALCVALFDRTPRLTNHSTVKVGRGTDDKALLGAQDVRTLLRRGSSQGWAEVDFESGDAKQYRARWSVRRARNQSDGTLQDEQLTLTAIAGGERFGGTKTETLKAIHARLGLSFDQFRRSALLAQGEFAAFLRADGKDRSELLERMTGTQIYSRLSVAAHVKAALAEQRLRDGRASALAIAVLDDDAARATRADLEVATAGAQLARRRHAAAEHAVRWRAEAAKRTQALAEATADHAAARAAVVGAEADRAELALRRRAEQLRPRWDQVVRLDRAVAAAGAEAVAAGAAAARAAVTQAAVADRRTQLAAMHAPVRAARIAAGIAPRAGEGASVAEVAGDAGWLAAGGTNSHAAQRLAQFATTAADDAAWLVARGSLAPEIAGWSELAARFTQHAALGEAIAAVERALDEQADAKVKLERAHKVLLDDLRAANAKHEEAKRKATGFSQKRGLTLDAARRQEDEARTRLAEVDRLVGLATAARAAIASRAELDAQLAQLAATAAEETTRHAQLVGTQRVLQALRVEQARVVEDLRRAAGYEHARTELVEHEPCPLCGATEHPWRDRGALDGMLEGAADRLTSTMAELDAVSTDAAAITVRAQHHERERVRLTAQRAAVTASAGPAVETWRSQLRALGELLLVDDPASPAAERLAADRHALAKKALEDARTMRSQTEAATKAAQDAQAQVQLCQIAVDALAAKAGELQQRIAELDATLGRGRGERASKLEHHAALAGELSAAMARWSEALPSAAGGTAPLPAGGTAPLPAGGTAPLPAGGTAPLPAGGTAPLPARGTEARRSGARAAQTGAATRAGDSDASDASDAPGALLDAMPLPRAARSSTRRSAASASTTSARTAVTSTAVTSTASAGTASAGAAAASAAAASAAAASAGSASRYGFARASGAVDPALALALVERLQASAPQRTERHAMPSTPLEIVQLAMAAVVAVWRERVARLLHADAALSAAADLVEREARDADRAVAEHTARRGAAEQRRAELELERTEATAQLTAAREAAGFAPDELQRVLSADPSRVDVLAERLGALDRAVDRTRAVVTERARQVTDHAAMRPEPEPALDAILGPDSATPGDDAALVAALTAAVTDADRRVAQLDATLKADADARARRADALASLAADEAGAEVDRILGEVIGSHDGKLFRSFAQSLTLDSLLAVANAHLEELAPRYQLERVPRHDLELQVIDRDLGSEVRSVQSLSGGESFLVSLALALGLSSMSAHDVRVRTLLIDEGFGTLDPSTLDSALSVLDALQATGRQVGVISHVPALVERVGAHVRVVQRGGGRSEVIVA